MAIDTAPRTPARPRTPASPRTPAPRTPAIPGTRPVTAPRHTRPVTVPALRPGRPGPGPGRGPAAPRPARARSPRLPFILLLVGLLGGALVSLLVISTTLAQGSFQVTHLQQQNASLARQEQTLTNQVARAANPAVIANEARRFGMRPNPHLGFIDQKTGKIIVGKPSRAEAAINVPGYTP